MKLEVHIKDKIFTMTCGEGSQKIRWIADAAVVRYQHFYSPITANPVSVSIQDGKQLPMDNIIKDTLNTGDNVWVMFKEDLEAIGINIKGKRRPQTANDR